MVDHDDGSDEHDGSDHGHSAPAADPVLIALQLCALANNKTVAAAIKKLRKLDRQYADTQAKVAALAAHAEQRNAALVQREAAIDDRERALDARATEFEASLHEARDHLRGFYDSVAEADRHIRYRILSHADLLGGYNAQLQDLPSWSQLRRLVVGLPDDPPPLERDVASQVRIDALSDTFSDPHADRHGNLFLGSLRQNPAGACWAPNSAESSGDQAGAQVEPR
jgi:hypothetical protein